MDFSPSGHSVVDFPSSERSMFVIFVVLVSLSTNRPRMIERGLTESLRDCCRGGVTNTLGSVKQIDKDISWVVDLVG